MIKACLFDIGNVLVTIDFRRTLGNVHEISRHSYDEVRRHLTGMIAELETGRLTTKGFVASALEYVGAGMTDASFRHAYTAIFDLIEPVWELVEQIQRTVPVYLFSNTGELHETALFNTFPQFNRFNGGFYSWRIGSMKPEEPMYRRALEELGVPAENIAYVDDLGPNIETGRRLGFQCHQYDVSCHIELLTFFRKLGLPAKTEA